MFKVNELRIAGFRARTAVKLKSGLPRPHGSKVEKRASATARR
jgi:hypothetical protein